MSTEVYDCLVIGGGVNGCGIARDAQGRGLSVFLAEKSDLASATSSASTKLFHGGLRYLEYYEFRLVREALIERETLLRAMPHISWPMRFVLPLVPRGAGGKVRPAWMVRLGLFLYDSLGGRKILPGTSHLNLARDPEGEPLKSGYRRAFEYSDCWVDDARLVALNARDAAERGAVIRTRTEVTGATRGPDHWTVELKDMSSGQSYQVQARVLVNAAGPWVAEVLHGRLRLNAKDNVRLVRGSHVVVPKLYDHDKCYFLQGQDGRIMFTIPYEDDFTLIGTTDAEHPDPDTRPVCSEAERDYMLAFVNRFFERQLTAADVVWSYSGVRPLHDDGATSATAATRDYVLRLDKAAGAPVLNVFGGKITTYRKLAEHAVDEITGTLTPQKGHWTAGVPLPGGDFAVSDRAALARGLAADYPFLTPAHAARLVRSYGTDARAILGTAHSMQDLGTSHGATLTGAELDWLVEHEFARSAEDVVWRRSKLGLRMSPEEIAALDMAMLADAPARRLA